MAKIETYILEVLNRADPEDYVNFLERAVNIAVARDLILGKVRKFYPFVEEYAKERLLRHGPLKWNDMLRCLKEHGYAAVMLKRINLMI